jgi:hypothetical protein
MDYDITAKEELEDLLENGNYDLRNCKNIVRNEDVFNLPNNINFITIDDRFDIL